MKLAPNRTHLRNARTISKYRKLIAIARPSIKLWHASGALYLCLPKSKRIGFLTSMCARYADQLEVS